MQVRLEVWYRVRERIRERCPATFRRVELHGQLVVVRDPEDEALRLLVAAIFDIDLDEARAEASNAAPHSTVAETAPALPLGDGRACD